MFTPAALTIFEKNNYSVHSDSKAIKLISPDKPHNAVIFLLVICIVSIPFSLFFWSTPASLLILFIALFPAYNILKKSEVPQIVTINLVNQQIELFSINGIKSESILFRHIQEISIGSFEETSDSNAFKDEVLTTSYYITIEARGKKYDIFRFKNTDVARVNEVKKETEKITSEGK